MSSFNLYAEENKDLSNRRGESYMEQISRRFRKTEEWPAIQRLWREGDWNDIKGETPQEIENNSLSGHVAYNWLHGNANTVLVCSRLKYLRTRCSQRVQTLIDAAIEEMQARENER